MGEDGRNRHARWMVAPRGPLEGIVPAMRVIGLWRYPVKSMQGESIPEAAIVAEGVAGDRGYGVLDLGSGTVVSAKRDGRLLEASARRTDHAVAVSVPGYGEAVPGAELDDHLSAFLGRPVRLVACADHPGAEFENFDDFERENSPIHRWSGPPGSFVDTSPIHLLATSDLAELGAERPELDFDVRRFRPNVLVDDEGDPRLLASLGAGERLRAGAVELEIKKPCARCVMTTRPQPGGIRRELDVLRHINAQRGSNLGLLASVVRPGSLRLGDELELA
jgi:uncharacterized protein